MSRPNIYARLQWPWIVVTLIITAVGVLFLVFNHPDRFSLLILASIMMIAWVARIKPRAALIDEEEEVKRKHKHPVYRRKKES